MHRRCLNDSTIVSISVCSLVVWILTASLKRLFGGFRWWLVIHVHEVLQWGFYMRHYRTVVLRIAYSLSSQALQLYWCSWKDLQCRLCELDFDTSMSWSTNVWAQTMMMSKSDIHCCRSVVLADILWCFAHCWPYLWLIAEHTRTVLWS